MWRGRRERWREMAGIFGACAAILGTWFGWVWVRFGLSEAEAANSTLKHASPLTAGGFFLRWGRNIVNSTIPRPLRVGNGYFQQDDWRGFLRDYMFTLYQHNWLMAMGLAGGATIVVLAYERLRSRDDRPARWKRALIVPAGIVAAIAASYIGPARDVIFDLFPTMVLYGLMLVIVALVIDFIVQVLGDWGRIDPELGFWRGMILLLPPLAIGTTDCLEESGLAHIYLQPLILTGLVLLAVSFRQLPRWWRVLVVAGAAVDYVLGVGLQLGLEHHVFHYGPGIFGEHQLQTDGLLLQAAVNWQEKQEAGLAFFGDHFGQWAVFLQVGMALAVAAGLVGLARLNDAPSGVLTKDLDSRGVVPTMPA